MNKVVRKRSGRRTVGAKGISCRVSESIDGMDAINWSRGSDTIFGIAIDGYFSGCAVRGDTIIPVSGSSIYQFDVVFDECDQLALRTNYTGLSTKLSTSTVPMAGDLMLVAFANGESAGFAEFLYTEY